MDIIIPKQTIFLINFIAFPTFQIPTIMVLFFRKIIISREEQQL